MDEDHPTARRRSDEHGAESGHDRARGIGSGMTVVRDVADGVHVISRGHTNMFVVEADERLVVVDAGLPSFWPEFRQLVRDLGRDRETMLGVVVTHGHFDHVGIAAKLHDEWRVPVWVAPGDRHLAAHPYSYRHERNRAAFLLTHPGGLGVVAGMAREGALSVRGVADTAGLPADLPGIDIVPSPGHTDGHVAVHLTDRDVIFTGDALVTRDPYTGKTGPRIVAGAATADSWQALSSLQTLTDTGAGLVLPGHGGPWQRGIGAAVEAALHVGAH